MQYGALHGLLAFMSLILATVRHTADRSLVARCHSRSRFQFRGLREILGGVHGLRLATSQTFYFVRYYSPFRSIACAYRFLISRLFLSLGRPSLLLRDLLYLRFSCPSGLVPLVYSPSLRFLGPIPVPELLT
jgi:hypothetical protein